MSEKKTDAERFWEKTIPAPTGDCILWKAASKKDGYGNFTLRWPDGGPRWVTASRWAYEQANGSIDPNLQVHHTCDFAACVNPEHLYQGTPKQNTADAYSKGRFPSKMRKMPFDPERIAFIQAMAPLILTNEKVIAIQTTLKAGESFREVADKNEIKIGLVHLIARAVDPGQPAQVAA